MFTISAEQVNMIVANISGVIGDLMPFILLIMGIGLAVWIIESLALPIKNKSDTEK